MTIAVVLVLTALILSVNDCASSNITWLDRITLCMQIPLFKSEQASSLDGVVYLPAKYCFLIAVMIFAVGFLWHRGAVPLPLKKKSEDSSA